MPGPRFIRDTHPAGGFAGPRHLFHRYLAAHHALNGWPVNTWDAAHAHPVLNALALHPVAYGVCQGGGAVAEGFQHLGDDVVHDGLDAKNFASLCAKKIARKPGKITCVRSLGEQVAEFMAKEGVSPGAMAERVGTFRQNIENLVAGDVRNPRYLRELATVMRTTADVLLLGAYVYSPKGSAPVREGVKAGMAAAENR